MTYLTLKMTLGAVKNDTVELAILKYLYMDLEIISVSLLEVTLAQDTKLILQTQVTNPEVVTFQSFSKGVYGYSYRLLDERSNLLELIATVY